jgi:hypothetical protein
VRRAPDHALTREPASIPAFVMYSAIGEMDTDGAPGRRCLLPFR